MASRKEQKEQARQARIAAEQAAQARAARNQRLGIIGGVVVIAVIIAVVAVVISSGGSKNKGLQTNTTAAKATYATVAKELAGIPQSGTTLGNPKAKVTLQYFGDLQCPVCQAFTLGTDGGGLPQLISGPVKQGKLKIVYRSMCTATGCPTNQNTFNTQQVAAYAAGKQNLFWNYAELFYHEQGEEDTGYVNNAYLTGLAKQIPSLNLSQWQSDRHSGALLSQVQNDGTAANKDQISGTPGLVAIGPKGASVIGTGAMSYSQVMQGISSVE